MAWKRQGNARNPFYTGIRNCHHVGDTQALTRGILENEGESIRGSKVYGSSRRRSHGRADSTVAA